MKRMILPIMIIAAVSLAATGCRMTSNMALPSSLANYDRTPMVSYEEAGKLDAWDSGFWLFCIPISTPSAEAVLRNKVPQGWVVENLDIDAAWQDWTWPLNFPVVRVRGTLLKPIQSAK